MLVLTRSQILKHKMEYYNIGLIKANQSFRIEIKLFLCAVLIFLQKLNCENAFIIILLKVFIQSFVHFSFRNLHFPSLFHIY
jgi:hypothetical protein